MSFMDARDHGAKAGSGGQATAQAEVSGLFLRTARRCIPSPSPAHHSLAPPTPTKQKAVDRRERLRRLALETIDLAKDPYYFRNHLGQVNVFAATAASPPPLLSCSPSATQHNNNKPPRSSAACA